MHIRCGFFSAVDYCHEVNCNSGYCVNHQTTYECVCLEGFEGQHCNLQHCSEDHTCWNNGICQGYVITSCY